MERCRILWEYAEFIGQIRLEQDRGLSLEDAVHVTISSCIRANVLADFLIAHRAEVMEMVIYEYDEAKHIASEKRVSKEEGRREGQQEKLIQQVCRKLIKGKDPTQIAEELEEDPDTILKICEAAAAFAPEYNAQKVITLLLRADDCDEF